METNHSLLDNLLARVVDLKPRDPIAFIYAYLKEASEGNNNPSPLSDFEINIANNLKKQVDFLNEQVQNINSKLNESSVTL